MKTRSNRIPERRLATILGVACMLWAASSFAQDEPAAPVKSWKLVCNQDAECKSTAKLPIDTGGEIEIWVARTGKAGDEYLGVLTPLGIHIPSGVALTFDQGKSAFAKLNLVDCKPVGCRAVIALAKPLEERMRKGKDVGVVLRSSESRDVVGLLVPLDGFTASLEKLRKVEAMTAADKTGG